MKKPESAMPPETAIERKPYKAPRIEESGQFEHLVLSCGLTDAPGETQLACGPNPRSS
jgi:hypothetical protein